MEELGRWTDEDGGKNVSARRGEERVKRGEGRGGERGMRMWRGREGSKPWGCGGTGRDPCKRGSWDGGKVRRERDSEN